MNNGLKSTLLITSICFVANVFLSLSAAAEEEAVMVTEKNLAMMPCKYVEKRIVTEANFMDVSTALLDDYHHDKHTQFDSRSYVNFRTIEEQLLRYFIHSSKADILPSLAEGDRIVITGVVTSCADQRPWVEVDSVIRAPNK